MNKKFCTNCSKPTTYEDSLPAFCASCGQPFFSSLANKLAETEEVSPSQTRKQPQQTENPRHPNRLKGKVFRGQLDENEDENENTEYANTNFEPIKLEIESLPVRQKTKLENLAFDKGPKEQISRPRLKKMNKKQIAEDFKKEMDKGNKTSPIEILGNNS